MYNLKTIDKLAFGIIVGRMESKRNTDRFFDDPSAWVEYMTGKSLWSRQKGIAQAVVDNRNVAVKAAHGTGKAQAVNTPIMTTEGWSTIGELCEGDTIYDESGATTQVVAKSEIWKVRPLQVTFDDGTVETVHPEHEWNVLDLNRRSKIAVKDWRAHWNSTVTKTTKELLEEGVKTSAKQNRWRIPLTAPVQMPEASLPIDPYLLGFWLGDGTVSNGTITLGTKKEALFEWLDDRNYRYAKRWNENKNAYTLTIYEFKKALEKHGLLNNRHIPLEYLRASIGQRRDLLAGIMDADGFLMKPTGGADVGIDMTDKTTSEDIYELLVSLGNKVFWKEGVAAYSLNGERHVTGTRYRMNWVPIMNPFKIRGQGWSNESAQRSRHTQRTIVSIVELNNEIDTQCIQVDSPRSLYLSGKSLVPTHNSYLAALLIVWWIDTRYPNAFVASTAPSQAQISAIVWRYVRQIKSLIEQRYNEEIIDHKLPGYITADNQWKEDGGNILGFGRKPPDNKEDDSFQGIHDAYVLAIGDESVGLSQEIIDALGNITSNENSRRVLICNPTNPNSYLGKLFKNQTETWNFQTISAFDSPNFTEERHTMDPEVLGKLVGPSYVEDKKAEYGEDSPRYKSRVQGEFAYDLGDTLIKESDVMVAVDTEFFIPAETTRRVLGCDVSRYGDDSSVVYLAEWTAEGQKKVRFLDTWGEAPTTESASRIHKWAMDHAVHEVRVDGHGLGGGVLDNLELMPGNYHIIDMNSNATTNNRKQWHNARAYWWDTMRSELRTGVIDMDLADETLRDELCSVEYGYSRQSGGLLVESKDDMRRRGQKSPDFADAAIYSCADMSHLFEGEINNLQPGTVIDFTESFDYEPDWFVAGMM